MIKYLLLFFSLFFNSFFGYSQEVDTDKLYLQALQEYRSGNFDNTINLTATGLATAPDYHDIRILQVRAFFALQRFEEAEEDIELLLTKSPNYVGVKAIALQRLNQLTGKEALDYNERLLKVYEQDPELRIQKARLLLKSGKKDKAEELISDIYSTGNLSDGKRYLLQQLHSLTVQNAMQVTGQYISFSEDYNRNDSWYALSAEYQHNFNNLSLIGRATYSDRSYNSGSLYEIEAYPVFSDKMYGFANLGISEGQIYPDYRASASIFYNFATAFEFEAGFRSLFYNDNSYLTAIAGLTAYTGKFYLNARAFAGPERREQVLQNYQFNVRYYLNTPENYLFGRIGSGISPDEPTLYTRAQENPTLEALYFNIGINKTLGLNHVVMLSGGLLSEDLPNEKTGTQFTAGLGYRYKF
jgi:YaiO family outer membrane protein